jgi:hypothetical protein
MTMKRTWVLLGVASLTSLWLASGVAYAEDWQGKSDTKTSGNIQVEFITQADGSVVGDNNIAVQLKDTSTGQPIVRDSVTVQLLMDAGDTAMTHGGMGMSAQDPVAANLKAVQGTPGRYSGKVSFSNAGDWKARVAIDPRGIQAPLTFSVRVSSAGPNWLIIGGFLAIIAAAVGIVLAMKRKSTPAASLTPTLEAGEA